MQHNESQSTCQHVSSCRQRETAMNIRVLTTVAARARSSKTKNSWRWHWPYPPLVTNVSQQGQARAALFWEISKGWNRNTPSRGSKSNPARSRRVSSWPSPHINMDFRHRVEYEGPERFRSLNRFFVRDGDCLGTLAFEGQVTVESSEIGISALFIDLRATLVSFSRAAAWTYQYGSRPRMKTERELLLLRPLPT